MRKQLITAAILAAFAGAPQFASAADDAKKNMTGTEMKAATVSATLDLDTKQIGLIVGGQSGEGVLHYQGKDYPFHLKGLRVSDHRFNQVQCHRGSPRAEQAGGFRRQLLGHRRGRSGGQGGRCFQLSEQQGRRDKPEAENFRPGTRPGRYRRGNQVQEIIVFAPTPPQVAIREALRRVAGLRVYRYAEDGLIHNRKRRS